jgi:MoxR-like ATPase
VGQEEVINQLLIAIFTRNHALLVGVPGLAKTLLISTLAQTMNLAFKRIQFTPDLMPSDITGTEVIQQDPRTGERVFRFIPGPIFANVVLADEINRTPPKTQAAMLEAMQERRVTVGGALHPLPEPFFVLATQNPIEQEGTYPLPEIQQDRFMFSLIIDYLPKEQELEVVNATTSASVQDVATCLDGQSLIRYQEIVRQTPVAEPIIRYAVELAARSRPGEKGAPQFVKDYVSWGASIRGSHYLVLGAKARAVLSGRPYVSIKDVQSVASAVLRHRIVTNFHAESENITSEEIVRRLLDTVPTPKSGL